MQGAGITIFWLGIHDKAIENTFVYASDDSPIEWNNWDDGQPNDWKGQDCAYVESKDASLGTAGKWGDCPCDSQKSVVCVRNKGTCANK